MALPTNRYPESTLTELALTRAAPHTDLPAGHERARPDLAYLADQLSEAGNKGARHLAALLESSLPDTATLLAMLPAEARLGSPHGYTRHLVHADPFGSFSAMLLVWRPGQHSPVHGHRTWCAYRVLQGSLRERHFGWNAATLRAAQTGAVLRQPGDTFSVPAGLRHIHGLGNDGDGIAVSLHVYGVAARDIATGVNLLVETDAAS